MLTPDTRAYGVIRVVGVSQRIADCYYTIDIYVTLRDALGHQILAYIVRAPFRDGVYVKRVPHHADAAGFTLDSWMSYPHGPIEPGAVTYRTTVEKPE